MVAKAGFTFQSSPEARELITSHQSLAASHYSPMPAKTAAPRTDQSSGSRAFSVAAGIMLSRVAGLIRERVLAHYLGTLPAADAFRAALRIPNFLQNLFGEGVLSASFIPVYSRLLAASDEKDANE